MQLIELSDSVVAVVHRILNNAVSEKSNVSVRVDFNNDNSTNPEYIKVGNRLTIHKPEADNVPARTSWVITLNDTNSYLLEPNLYFESVLYDFAQKYLYKASTDFKKELELVELAIKSENESVVQMKEAVKREDLCAPANHDCGCDEDDEDDKEGDRRCLE